ncbi:MAG: hypothetical protein M1305_03180 [Candidatus Marsarchaeota archaeon]|nr:hypothetical protein [Candidatus Marsarchaeota archaeon]
MRILLDSRDLINLAEHGRPIAIEEYAAYLRASDHFNVLTFTNIRELVAPLAQGAEFMDIRPMLQSLEQVPHTYLNEVPIIGLEIRSAVQFFEDGIEGQSPDVYTTRWDHVLQLGPGQRRLAADNWVNLRLDDIVYLIYRFNNELFAPPVHHLPLLQRLVAQDRDRLRASQAPARLHFVRAIRKHATSFRVQLPPGKEDEFAEWVYQNPSRCPGLRLQHEIYRALMANYGDVPEVGDFSDLAHICALPYVEAATFDRRMRHYCEVASRELLGLGCVVDYRDRVYQDLGSLMQANPRP